MTPTTNTNDDDIDELMAEELDAKGDELWEQGAREVLGDEEFERLYPELKRNNDHD